VKGLRPRPSAAREAARPGGYLGHVESRQVDNDYTIQVDRQIYQITRQDLCAGLRDAIMRGEKRRDGALAARFRDRYLGLSRCAQWPLSMPSKPAVPKPRAKPVKRSEWGQNFDLKKRPKIWQAAQGSGARTAEMP